ncbi:death-associated protein isoform X1 [Acyrthosiphon pisum]|uniref:ACYPI007535 protein n=1 Tax=Acyrthosiphon pisum TaxID=7029 RepID=C4WRY6_ACYPI|nr:death-associated protein [Acyrthosiphon pisum]XP_008190190.1 death-associated protein isoform X1 [Acyrthosiphon pisum]XP_029344792.1 death-associated protein isoform X1 [Acyrthosiphon pisum]BAH70656.1 ACYPI007535 [Acyrthosiphon pisum]BAH70657.1 ACYPI007535 [Acyrthosiphon pisum]BAH70658.1 ACYPI007535 [Acyrthosiphon pisum]BAH70659.1 ACYPI007535 [Acyrthosiphon pisum]|eukprot:NP_001155717.1 death-associated protein [Acyrthosiphon pisum]
MEDESQLKGGHAQAVKAGGMRIVQHKNLNSAADKISAAASDEANSVLKVSTSPPKQTVVPVHAHNDYPTQAVQKTHDKPTPSHEMRQHTCTKPTIHQPRK